MTRCGFRGYTSSAIPPSLSIIAGFPRVPPCEVHLEKVCTNRVLSTSRQSVSMAVPARVRIFSLVDPSTWARDGISVLRTIPQFPLTTGRTLDMVSRV